MSKKKLVSIVVSVYNEEESLPELYRQLKQVLSQCHKVDHEIIFVNDGSKDDSLAILQYLVKSDQKVRVVNFARNFGHEIAMTAGLDHSRGKAVIFMDADLQHPPKLILQMIEKWLDGYDLVLTKLIRNEDKSLFRTIITKSFYRILNLVSDVKITEGAPDFRLVGEKYIATLKNMREGRRMFRGMLKWLGLFNVAEIEFYAPKRFAGKSHYNLRKSLQLALDSILQFSIKPLRISIYFSMICAIGALSFGIWTIYEHYALQHPSTGYASIVCLIVFLFSLQFIILGIIGEYVGRIHIESKNRPLYFADVIENNADRDFV